MTVHVVNTPRPQFLALLSGAKTCSIHNATHRTLKVGDIVQHQMLEENGRPSERSLRRSITHLDEFFGLAEGHVLASYCKLTGQP